MGKRSRGLFFHGRTSNIGLTAKALTTRTDYPIQMGAIVVKAGADNAGRVYVGSTDAVTADSNDATDGIELTKDGFVNVEIDDPSKIFVIANVENQKVFWIGM